MYPLKWWFSQNSSIKLVKLPVDTEAKEPRRRIPWAHGTAATWQWCGGPSGTTLWKSHVARKFPIQSKIVPSGKLRCLFGTSPCLIGNSTIFLAIFNRYAKLPGVMGKLPIHGGFSILMFDHRKVVMNTLRHGESQSKYSWAMAFIEHSYRKTTFWTGKLGKSSMNGSLSIAMLVPTCLRTWGKACFNKNNLFQEDYIYHAA